MTYYDDAFGHFFKPNNLGQHLIVIDCKKIELKYAHNSWSQKTAKFNFEWIQN